MAAYSVDLPIHAYFNNIGKALIGAILLRSSACTINDIFDREMDAGRTRNRPLASARISVVAATLYLIAQYALVALMRLGTSGQVPDDGMDGSSSFCGGMAGLFSIAVADLVPLSERGGFKPMMFACAAGIGPILVSSILHLTVTRTNAKVTGCGGGVAGAVLGHVGSAAMGVGRRGGILFGYAIPEDEDDD
ncbi:hypothetical protein C8R46DRAFT_1226176 [Mycena filopes]|nr:hypothetical protein C8R46DRAFT_1226176 [Mycena filopes]